MAKNKGGFERFTAMAGRGGEVIRPELWNNHPYLLCSGCGQRFVETRQLNKVRVKDGVMYGACPACGTELDLTPLIQPPEPGVVPPLTDG